MTSHISLPSALFDGTEENICYIIGAYILYISNGQLKLKFIHIKHQDQEKE